jgi:hypothetical protein
MKNQFIFVSLMLICLSSTQNGFSQSGKRQVYQLTVYHFTNAEQESQLDNYLQQALLPGLHGYKISKIGVFKPLANDTATDKRIYVMVPFANINEAWNTKSRLRNDKSYQEKAVSFENVPHNKPAYSRIETILMEAFSYAPSVLLPKLSGNKAENIYELRSYESSSEKYYRSKVHMFNEGGEIALFKRLNFNGIFYGEVFAGSRQPNFLYMTSFENIADRDAHWKTFGDDAEWKTLLAKPEYQNNVSKAEIILMHATNYSDY